jgi:NitT/TauT family transport system substrate-binding protein
MYKSRQCQLSAALLIFVFALVGCKKPEAQKVHIAVVSQTAFTSLPVTVAQELGYFKSENLAVTIEDVKGPSSAIQALSGRSADVAASIPDVILLAAAEGKQFRSFELMCDLPGLALAVSPGKESEVRTFRDLRGKTIGIVSLGSSAEIYVRYLASRQGLKQEDIHFVQSGSPAARIAAMESGQVDAAVISEPAISILRRRHNGIALIADCRTEAGAQDWFGSPQYPGSAVFSTPEWVAKNPTTVRSLARAIVRAQNWMRAQPPDVTAKKMPPAFLQADPIAFVEGLTVSTPSYSQSGRFKDEAVQKAWEVIANFSEKARNHPVNLQELFTNDYLPK